RECTERMTTHIREGRKKKEEKENLGGGGWSKPTKGRCAKDSVEERGRDKKATRGQQWRCAGGDHEKDEGMKAKSVEVNKCAKNGGVEGGSPQ
ncbi:hypothetical protein KI387_041282, partial [Taxus chinensis]